MKKISLNAIILSTLMTGFQLINAQTTPNAVKEEIPVNENVTIVNEKTVNTGKLDFSPTFYQNGIVFLSSNALKDEANVKDKKIKEQTFNIKLGLRGPTGMLNSPTLYAKELATVFHEGPLCFDATTSTVYFSRNNSADGKLTQVKNKEDRETSARQQLYTAKKQGNNWVNEVQLPFNNGEYAFRHPSLSLDGKKLYFSSNRPGGQGGYDIWVSKKIGEEWGEPVNLGTKINTPQNEGFPFIFSEDEILLFASDGHGGAGKLDMFYSMSEKGRNFQSPVNLGRPFNSEFDDFGLILDLERKNGYFTSDRTGGQGLDDIYSFTSEEPIINPKPKKLEKAVICVLDKADESPIEAATVKYANLNAYDMLELPSNANTPTASNNVNILQIVDEKPNKVLTTDATCKAEFNVDEGQYIVNVVKEGYTPKQIIIKTNPQTQLYKVYLEKTTGMLVNGILKNDRGLPIGGAVVTITDPDTGETQTVTTDPQGRYTFLAKPKKKYTITGNKPNHEPITTTYETPDDPSKMAKDFVFNSTMKELVSPLKKGLVFELTNVYYNFNDASLRPDARRDLEALYTVMQAYPEVEIELGSHTDCRGSHGYNDDLSRRRAESVVQYLVERGITKSRMSAKGYGENQLRNQCADGVECTEDEHQRNRRTEVMLTRGASNAEIVVVNKEPEYTDPMPGRHAGGPAIADGGGKGMGNYSNNNGGNNYSGEPIYTNSDPNGVFWVVAGSFNNQQNAVEQQVKMMNRGLQETTVEFASNINFYRVVISKQATQEAAEATARSLRSKGVNDLFVVRN